MVVRSFNNLVRSTTLAMRGRSGLTRLEVVVVVGVFGLLGALLLPATYRTRESARRVQAIDKMRGIGVAIHASEEINGRLPGGSADSGLRRPRRAGAAEIEPFRFESVSPDKL